MSRFNLLLAAMILAVSLVGFSGCKKAAENAGEPAATEAPAADAAAPAADAAAAPAEGM